MPRAGSATAARCSPARHAEVVGVDVSEDAIAYARSRYARPNVEFRVEDLLAPELDDRSFDVVCSFETIEHLPDRETYLGHVARVLRDDGVYIVSTPRADETIEAPDNPHHFVEYSSGDFERLLRPHFGRVELFGQRRIQTRRHRWLQRPTSSGCGAGSASCAASASWRPVRTRRRTSHSTGSRSSAATSTRQTCSWPCAGGRAARDDRTPRDRRRRGGRAARRAHARARGEGARRPGRVPLAGTRAVHGDGRARGDGRAPRRRLAHVPRRSARYGSPACCARARGRPAHAHGSRGERALARGGAARRCRRRVAHPHREPFPAQPSRSGRALGAGQRQRPARGARDRRVRRHARLARRAGLPAAARRGRPQRHRRRRGIWRLRRRPARGARHSRRRAVGRRDRAALRREGTARADRGDGARPRTCTSRWPATTSSREAHTANGSRRWRASETSPIVCTSSATAPTPGRCSTSSTRSCCRRGSRACRSRCSRRWRTRSR